MNPTDDAARPATIPAPFPVQQPNDGNAPSVRRSWWRAPAALILYFAFSVFVGLVPMHPHRRPLWELAAIFLGPSIVFMFLQLWTAWEFVKLRLSLKLYTWTAVFAGLFWLTCHDQAMRAGGPQAQVYATVASNLFETVCLTTLGALLASIIREGKMLLPLGIVAGLVDTVGVMTPLGFTHRVIQHHPQLVQHVSISVPTVVHGLPIDVTIGPGDPLYIAFFFAVVLNHRLNARGTFVLVNAFLTLSILAVQFTPLPAIGALGPMGLAVILANLRFFDYTRAEKFAMLYASLVAFAGAMGFFQYVRWYMSHSG